MKICRFLGRDIRISDEIMVPEWVCRGCTLMYLQKGYRATWFKKGKPVRLERAP